MLNGAPAEFAQVSSFILDTTTVKTFKPTLAHKDFDRYGYVFWNHHKGVFGVKLEVAVAMQRTPVPIGLTVLPAGFHDLTIARRARGIFSRLRDGERGLGDPGYVGQSDKIYAPPRRGTDAYVEELDKNELTLQRRVEMANEHFKTFKCLGTIYRKGALQAFADLEIIALVVGKLIFLDLVLNQEHSGQMHATGPSQKISIKRERRKKQSNLEKNVRRTKAKLM